KDSPLSLFGTMVESVAFSPDGKLAVLYNVSSRSEPGLFEVASGKQLYSFKERFFESFKEGFFEGMASVAFSPDGGQILSANRYNSLRLWDMTTGKCLINLAGHTGRIFSAAFSRDGQLAASGSEDGTLRLWKIRTGECLGILHGDGPIRSVALSSDATFAFGA